MKRRLSFEFTDGAVFDCISSTLVLVAKMQIIPKIVFYPSLAYTVLTTRYTSRRWYDRVDETVLIGALPLKSVMTQLMNEEKVKAVLSMNESYELKLTYSVKELAAKGVDFLQISTVDLIGTPPLDRLKCGVDFILSHQRQGNSVYVHCKAGRTRSATMVACYLIERNQWKPEEAIAYLKQVRPHIWLRETQMNSIRSFYTDLSSGSRKKERKKESSS